jgi:RNA polymerase sigma-70 factor, ECF subfamily
VNKNISEENILEVLETDTEKAFRLIVEKYGSKIYWHARRLVIVHDDADDVVQNTFINVWKNIRSFRNESSLYTWLYTIATNESLALIKKREKRSSVPLDSLDSIFNLAGEGDTWFDGNEAERKLQDAILKLPEKQMIVFKMKYFEEMNYEDMSKILKTSVGALKASYHHAVKKIELFISGD